MEACPGISYIGVLATGYNIVDVEAAREKGITVTNIPSYGTAAVAQFAIALLLEVCHHAGGITATPFIRAGGEPVPTGQHGRPIRNYTFFHE
ncbi:hypothetical protein SDC9_86747 [bioreactor metagenome]|uniref:D-isomer specific 2-hydroxyacid dehydrogenase catalytic domain-containing protein n=1 Tax=bioreactor metagenome TaxID=1076179 RepID=A0A644ZH32_9ZZZZ